MNELQLQTQLKELQDRAAMPPPPRYSQFRSYHQNVKQNYQELEPKGYRNYQNPYPIRKLKKQYIDYAIGSDNYY